MKGVAVLRLSQATRVRRSKRVPPRSFVTASASGSTAAEAPSSKAYDAPVRLTSAVAIVILLGVTGEPSNPRTAGVGSGPGPLPSTQSPANSAMGNLPTGFEQNEGQAPAGVDFIARRGGLVTLLAADGPVMRVGSPTSTGFTFSGALKARFIGANVHVSPRGSRRLPGTANYIIGDRPNGWHAGIPTFAEVVYPDVYPGIRVVYHGASALEWDFILQPEADPAALKLRLEGASDLDIDRRGNLLAMLPSARLQFDAPRTYQVGNGSIREIESRYVLVGNEVTFALGPYDRTRPLVIDPAVRFSTYLGGSATEFGFSVARDSQGNIYVAGSTYSTDFPLVDAFQSDNAGAYDAFITKMSSDGSAILYSTYLGGSDDDTPAAVEVDRAGDAFVVGGTWSNDFPTTPGSFNPPTAGFTGDLMPSPTATPDLLTATAVPASVTLEPPVATATPDSPTATPVPASVTLEPPVATVTSSPAAPTATTGTLTGSIVPPVSGAGGLVGGNGGIPNPAQTPELGSLALFGTGVAGMAGYALARFRSRREFKPLGGASEDNES